MKYSNYLKTITFAFACAACFLISVEIILRILGYIYSRKPDLDEFNNARDFNIVCLGDSFTYGWGVDTACTYPKQLEGLLNNSGLDMRFKVFNLAVPASNSSQHLRYLEDIFNKYKKPDLIIILTGANDSWNLADSNIHKFINQKSRFGLLKSKIIRSISGLRIYKTAKIILMNLKGRPPGSSVDPFKVIQAHENVDQDILKKLLEYNLTKIVNLAKSNNVKIVLHNYPRGDLYGDNIAQKVALNFQVPFVDNFYVFNEKLKEVDFKDLFLYDNSHPNKLGCTIMAEGIYKTIIKNKIYEKSL